MINFMVFAYNEEDNIIPVLEKIWLEMKSLGYKYKVFVVDDGSNDSTVNKINSLSDKMPLETVRIRENMGVAVAFSKGIEAIRRDHPDPNDAVITWEGDNTMDPDAIGDMIAGWEKGGEVICNSRYIPGGRGYNILSIRFILSRVVNLILQTLFPIKGVNDYTLFARLYRWNVLEKALAHYGDKFVESDDFAFSPEMLLKMRRLKANIEQVPHNFQFDSRKGKSTLRIISRVADHLKLIFRGIR